MTKQDAVEWIINNFPTTTRDGTTVVEVDHDTDGETECPICGFAHDPTTEFHPVESLAERYHESMNTHLPDQAADAAKEAVAAAQERGTGHERFFNQFLD